MIEPYFVPEGCARDIQIAILPEFLPIEPFFLRKGCASAKKKKLYCCVGRLNPISLERVSPAFTKMVNLYLSFRRSNLISSEKSCAHRAWKSQFFFSSYGLNLISCEMILPAGIKIVFTSVLGMEPHLVGKGSASAFITKNRTSEKLEM